MKPTLRLRNISKRLIGSRMAVNAAALYVIQFSNYLIPLVLVPYLVRTLSPSGYGLGVYAQSFAGTFGLFLDYGFNLTATRQIAANRENKEIVNKITSVVLFTKLFLSILVLIIFCSILLIVPSIRVNSLVMMLAFMGTIANSFLPLWLYQGMEKLASFSMYSLGFRILHVPILFFLVQNPNQTWLWLFVVAVANIFTLIIVWWDALSQLKIHIDLPDQFEIINEVKQGFNIFSSQAAVSLYTTANTFILGTMTDLTIAGYFAAAEKLTRIVFNLLEPVNKAIFPRVSQLASNSRAAAMRLARISIIVTVSAASLLSIALFLFAPALVHIFLGNRFQESIPIVRLMSILPVLFSLGTVIGIQLLIPFHFDRGFAVIYLFAGIVNILLAFLLVPPLQGEGMAFSVLAAEILVVISQITLVIRNKLNPFAQHNRLNTN
jgi:polysaccharide transporter, PST family